MMSNKSNSGILSSAIACLVCTCALLFNAIRARATELNITDPVRWGNHATAGYVGTGTTITINGNVGSLSSNLVFSISGDGFTNYFSYTGPGTFIGEPRSGSNTLTITLSDMTNFGLASTNWVNAQGFVTQAITNGLASTNWVLSLGYVTADITNGLASTNWANATFYPLSNPSNYVTASITNGLASESWVDDNYLDEAAADLLYVAITDGVATNLTVAGTLTGDNITASGTIETDTQYLFDSVNAVRLYTGSDAYYGSVAVGEDAGEATTGSGANRQTALGYSAGRENSGAYQTALGYSAGYLNSGAHQAALGYQAGRENSGANQTALGHQAGHENSGANQIALGYRAGYLNSGDNQTAIGYVAGRGNSGDNQTAIGYFAGYLNSGVNQTALGCQAGRYIANGTTANTDSEDAVYLGANTRSLTANDDNIIVIGTDAIGKGSNTAVWGNTDMEEHYFNGALNLAQVATAPGAIASSGWIYAKTNEIYVLDGAGNETLISPHAGTDEWSFISHNRYTGRKISVDMEGVIRALERVSGEKLMTVEWTEPAQDWAADEAAKVEMRQAEIAAWDAESERRQFEEPKEGEDGLDGPLPEMGERPQPYTPRPVPAWITERKAERQRMQP